MSVLKSSAYNNVINVLQQVATSWLNNHPSFVCTSFSPQGFIDLSQRLAVERDIVAAMEMDKQDTTKDLQTHNALINKMADALRHFIRGYNIFSSNINSILGSYGLVAHTPTARLNKAERKTVREIRKAIADAQTPEEQAAAQTLADANAELLERGKKRGMRYIIPADNDLRMQTMQNIISRISRPGDPVGSSSANYVQSWIDAANEHQRLWRGSKNISSNKANPSQNSQDILAEAQSELDFFSREISARFRLLGDALTTKLRSFGFLAEVQ